MFQAIVQIQTYTRMNTGFTLFSSFNFIVIKQEVNLSASDPGFPFCESTEFDLSNSRLLKNSHP
jgi:hypothetical protein